MVMPRKIKPVYKMFIIAWRKGKLFRWRTWRWVGIDGRLRVNPRRTVNDNDADKPQEEAK